MIRDYHISNVRAVHTRALGILDDLQEIKDNHMMGLDAWVDKDLAYWDAWSEKSGRKHHYTRENVAERWPHEWTAEDQEVLDNLTEAVRVLDKYAHTKNQMFPKGVV